MEPFINFKNYLFTSAAAASASKDDTIDNSKIDVKRLSNIENRQSTSPSPNSSSNEEKKKFNFFGPTTTSDTKQPNKTKRNSGKFLKSKSYSSSDSDSLKSTKKGDSFKRENFVDNNDARDLFYKIECKLNELIEHFQTGHIATEEHIFESHQKDSDSFYKISPQCLDTSDTSFETYFKLTAYAKQTLHKCILHYNKIEPNLPYFDISPQLQSSGYRTILTAFESCCHRLLLAVNQINDTKTSFLFQYKLNSTLPGTINIKDFQAWVRLMEKIEIVLQIAVDIQVIQLEEINKSVESYEKGPSLFYNMTDSNDPRNNLIETRLLSLGSVHQESFFGRTCGFQFCESLQTPLTGCAVALASYNDGYEAYSTVNATSVQVSESQQPATTESATGQTTFMQGQATLFKSLVSGTKYVMDPELRAKKISKVMKDANVEFCKAFWQLTETDIVQMGSNMITPNVSVNLLKKISLAKPLTLPKVDKNNTTDELGETVTIQPPQSSNANDTIQIRVLSNEMRDGMQNLEDLKGIEQPALFNNLLNFQTTSYTKLTPTTPKSPHLLLHVHGGGFIAHSSKSHEIYLKPWCKELKIPIVSIDYSLAPEHMFPRASEECFFVYAWCLLNKEVLGWTGEKIILVGDSAGGLLSTNIVQRAIINKIRVPDALIPIYTPFQSTYSISPSRLMSVMDPLLNLGILWRCLAAYSGIDYKKETERFKAILDLNPSNSNSPSPESGSNGNKPAVMRASPSIASILKTTPFKSFLSRSSTQSPLAPTTPTTPTATDVNVRYSKRESFDFGPASFTLNNAEETVSIETLVRDEAEIIAKIEPELEKLKDSENDSSNAFLNTLDPLTTKQKQRLLQLHKVLGDSVFLIERLRNHPLARNQFMSPLLSDNSLLAQFPKTYLITTDQDPLLDDSIMMCKKLKKLNVACNLDVLDGLHHGFLNFIKNSKDCLNASKFVTHTIKSAIDPSLITQKPTIKKPTDIKK